MRTSEWLPLIVATLLVPLWLYSRAEPPSVPVSATRVSTVVSISSTPVAIAPPTGTPHPTLAACYYRQLDREPPESRELLTAMLAVAEPPDAMWNAEFC